MALAGDEGVSVRIGGRRGSPFFFEGHRDSGSPGEGGFGDPGSVFLGGEIRD